MLDGRGYVEDAGAQRRRSCLAIPADHHTVMGTGSEHGGQPGHGIIDGSLGGAQVRVALTRLARRHTRGPGRRATLIRANDCVPAAWSSWFLLPEKFIKLLFIVVENKE